MRLLQWKWFLKTKKWWPSINSVSVDINDEWFIQFHIFHVSILVHRILKIPELANYLWSQKLKHYWSFCLGLILPSFLKYYMSIAPLRSSNELMAAMLELGHEVWKMERRMLTCLLFLHLNTVVQQYWMQQILFMGRAGRLWQIPSWNFTKSKCLNWCF